MNQQKIIDRILKVKALADLGTDGERETAERLLKELMEKYHITEADLGVEVKEIHIFHLGESMFRHLFVQLHTKLFGRERPVYDISNLPKKEKKSLYESGFGDKDADAAIECTASEFLEISTLYSIYKEDFKQQFKIFRYAYYNRNELLVKSTVKNGKLSEEELERFHKAALMSKYIEKKQISKMIQ